MCNIFTSFIIFLKKTINISLIWSPRDICIINSGKIGMTKVTFICERKFFICNENDKSLKIVLVQRNACNQITFK